MIDIGVLGTILKIDLFLSQSEIQRSQISDQLVVIIDVLRASTSMITALANGCKAIISVSEIDKAKKLAKNFLPGSILLCGERNEVLIPGFDLSNSPLEYTADKVKDRTIIFTSSNGSKLFDYVQYGQKIIVAGFVNVTVIAKFIVESKLDVAILCAGKNGQFGLEDAVCGGMIINKIAELKDKSSALNDGAIAAQTMYQFYGKNIIGMLYQASHGKRLIDIGQEQDLLECGKIDAIEVIPILDGNELVPLGK